MKIGNLFSSFSNFLFSKANREFLIFTFFFALAGVFWLLTTLNENYEFEIQVPIRYTGIPKSAVMTSSETDTFHITVNDKGIVLLSYLYGDILKDITADFKTYAGKQKQGRGDIPSADLTKKVLTRLATSTKLVNVKPDHLFFYYNYGEKKRVPVKWRGTVMPEELYYISNIEYEPDSITIFASRDKLDSLNMMYTKPLNYTDFKDTLTIKAPLQPIAGVKMVPENVTINFMTDILTEEYIDGIEITGINMPEGKILRTFPSKARIKIVTGMKIYRTLSPTDFVVTADYNKIEGNLTPKCQIQLEKIPDGIRRASLVFDQVDYLIEEQEEP